MRIHYMVVTGLVTVSALSACALLTPVEWRGKGLQAVIEQTIPLAANSANVYLQDGKTTIYDHVDFYRPSCNLIFGKRLQQAREIPPQTCEVKGGGQRTTTAKLETLWAFNTILSDGGDSPMAQIYITDYRVNCPVTKDFLTIHCQQWDDPITGKHMTAEEIQSALRPYVRIQ